MSSKESPAELFKRSLAQTTRALAGAEEELEVTFGAEGPRLSPGKIVLPQIVQTEKLAGIANAMLRDMGELADHPQLEARNRWRTYDSPAGELRGLIPPVTFAGTEPLMGAIPEVGEHTEAILAELGLRSEAATAAS